MDYRDRDGYFQEDVFRVLGRSGDMSSSTASTATLGSHPLTYRGLRGYNFTDTELSSGTTSPTSSGTTTDDTRSTFSSESFDADAEWEDAKKVLYTTFVGFLLPLVCRYMGRRLTFSVWTRFLTSYFKF
ncbi:hypothetical protein GQ54DRAFT_261220 [Martensiomyces pterosporus]|nr:hypothetical protein GQ54DRAFT_261220 [Martensiomyces pterosporus]